MSARALAFAAILGAYATCAAGAQTISLPEPPPPAQTKIEWIGRHMKMNGLPMSLSTFESSQSPRDVLSHYSRWWSTSGQPADRTSQLSRRGEWEVLALMSSEVVVTVRAKPTRSGSTGDIAVSPNPSRITLSTQTAFPHPSNARVTNLQEYLDAGTAAEHVSLQTTRSPSISARDFSRALMNEGWTVYRDQSSQAFERGHVLEAQKGGDIAQLTFVPDTHAGTRVIVIWRKG